MRISAERVLYRLADHAFASAFPHCESATRRNSLLSHPVSRQTPSRASTNDSYNFRPIDRFVPESVGSLQIFMSSVYDASGRAAHTGRKG
jgi:hypothetical protein